MTATYSARNTDTAAFVWLSVDEIEPSPLNPRKTFDPEQLSELAESIRAHGVLQPIVVRPIVLTPETAEDTSRYDFDAPLHHIIAGERRWRAAKLAGLETIPATVLANITDEQHLRIALIENLHREDLDPIETAEGYAALNRIVGLRQAEIAAAVNRSQPAVANAMRLLELPEDVRERIRARELSVAHGVALARYKDFPRVVTAIADLAVERGMTSKAVEQFSLYNHPFIQAGVIRVLGHETRFDRAGCQSCPFGAYRKAESDYYAVCLKPEHYDELQAAAESQRRSAVEAKLALARASGVETINLVDLPYGEYENFRYDRRPAGCSEECPCYRLAVERDGQTTSICVDRKRIQALKVAETKQEKKAKRDSAQQRVDRIAAALDVSASISSRDLALLVAPQLTGTRKAVWAELRRHAPDLLPDEPMGSSEYAMGALGYDLLSRVPPAALVKLGVEARLRADLDNEASGYGKATKADWWLAGTDAADVSNDVSNESMPLPEASVSGETVECFLCGDMLAAEDAIPNGPPGEYLCPECDDSEALE